MSKRYHIDPSDNSGGSAIIYKGSTYKQSETGNSNSLVLKPFLVVKIEDRIIPIKIKRNTNLKDVINTFFAFVEPVNPLSDSTIYSGVCYFDITEQTTVYINRKNAYKRFSKKLSKTDFDFIKEAVLDKDGGDLYTKKML